MWKIIESRKIIVTCGKCNLKIDRDLEAILDELEDYYFCADCWKLFDEHIQKSQDQFLKECKSIEDNSEKNHYE